MDIKWDKVEFKGKKRFLSNMYKCKIVFNDNFGFNFTPDFKTYFSSEHLYQALKSRDLEYQELIRVQKEPKDAKKLANNLINSFYPLREDWHQIRVEAMEMVLLLKFTQNNTLARKLLDIKGEIEEKNSWNDTFWGTYNGVGENHLGKLLMKIREKTKK